MEIFDLPLHPLVVHGAVVFTPLAAVAALAYLVPRWRDRLRWPMPVTALVATGAVVMAYLSGNSFRDANAFFNDPSLPVTAQIDTHEQRGTWLLWMTLAFATIALAAAALHQRNGVLRWLLGGALAVGAVAVLVLVVLTGDAGARAVWGGFAG